MCKFCGSDDGDVPCDIFEKRAKASTKMWIKQTVVGNGYLEREEEYEFKRSSKERQAFPKKR